MTNGFVEWTSPTQPVVPPLFPFDHPQWPMGPPLLIHPAHQNSRGIRDVRANFDSREYPMIVVPGVDSVPVLYHGVDFCFPARHHSTAFSMAPVLDSSDESSWRSGTLGSRRYSSHRRQHVEGAQSTTASGTVTAYSGCSAHRSLAAYP